MKNLRFICAQPAIPYYTWQVEVMIHNFMEMGVNPNNIDIVCGIQNNNLPNEWKKLVASYPYVRFFFYNDNRTKKVYPSSIRPNILKQHWKANPSLYNETIFYHDCDILFTKPISEWVTDEMINDDNWYGSDCRWYIAHSYIKSKGDDVMNMMCGIMNIDEGVIKDNEMNSIGAQYIMKRITEHFWSAVEIESERLFTEVSELNKRKKTEDPTYHELQIWCADMWAVLWNGWKLNFTTICHPNLSFSWGTSPINEWDKHNIMHNAGVTTDKNGLFYKAKYMTELPYNRDLQITPNTVSYKYYEWIQKVEKKTILI